MIALLAVLAMATAGCTKSNTDQVDMIVDVTCDEFTAQQHISKEVEIPLNGLLVVSLCSNPTTGFQWSETAQIIDQTILEQMDHESVSPKGKVAPGVPGGEIWTFKATEKGTTKVSIEYSRPWEGGERGGE